VVEGRLVVARLLADRRWTVRSLLLSYAAARSLESALSLVPPAVPIFVCDRSDFLGITGYDIHRGCLALVERPPVLELDVVANAASLVLVLEGIANADNVGGLFRNAAAFGADAVLLSPTCCSPLYRKAVRTSVGAALCVPFVHAGDWPGPLGRLRRAGFTIAALVADRSDRCESLEAFASRPAPSKLALMLGSEGFGLTADAESMSDHLVHIPIERGVDSLNVAVAAGIALEQMTRTRQGRGILAPRIGP
jgi:tRNA G18 (ribose-2'-O)-methylase SpoU